MLFARERVQPTCLLSADALLITRARVKLDALLDGAAPRLPVRDAHNTRAFDASCASADSRTCGRKTHLKRWTCALLRLVKLTC